MFQMFGGIIGAMASIAIAALMGIFDAAGGFLPWLSGLFGGAGG